MLYRFDRTTHRLDELRSVDAFGASVLEKDIELALASTPECVFTKGSPVLIVKKFVAWRRMADIIAVDAEGRLVLIECKRGWADRDALSQLLSYAAEYAADAFARLCEDWKTGEGRDSGRAFLEAFREFADDRGIESTSIGKDHVLVVVAAGRDDGFQQIARYLESRGVPVYFVPIALFMKADGELFIEVKPIDLAPSGTYADGPATERATADIVWMINTDETHSPGAWKRFIECGVAAIWGYPDGPATLQAGVKAGDVIYAYQNGVGIVGRGTAKNGDVTQAPPGSSVIPECNDGNEWHLAVDWMPVPPGKKAVTNREVRQKTGTGLPVRNTFCRVLKANVRKVIGEPWEK
ncbi:hypothetical protein WME94_08275 [Sorangium sp. So ce429]